MSQRNSKSKLMSAPEAVSRFVKDGDLVALGGFTVSRNPMTLAREIIRQGKKDLHLAVHSQGQAMDLLVGAGCVRRLEIAYGGTGRFAPTCIRFRQAVQKGLIEIEDAETGGRRWVDTSSARVRQAYAAEARRRVAARERLLQSLSIDHVDLWTDRDYVKPMVEFFRRRASRY